MTGRSPGGDLVYVWPLPISSATVGYSIDIVMRWAGAAADTFVIAVPDNWIDLSMGSVPEPTGLALPALGGAALAGRSARRRGNV